MLRRTTAFGYYDDNYLLAVERRTDHLGAAAPARVPASGCGTSGPARSCWPPARTSGSIAFADNDRARRHAGRRRPGPTCNRYGVLPGRRAVVFTTNDSAYAAALDLAAAGVEVVAVVDARPTPATGRGAPTGRDRRCGRTSVIGVRGDRTTGRCRRGGRRRTADRATRGRPAGRVRRLEPGAAPVQPGRRHGCGGRAGLGAFVPGSGADQAVDVVGARRTATVCDAGAAVLGRRARTDPARRLRRPAARRRPWPTCAGDRRRDALGRARQALHDGGTAHDQGKTSGVLAVGVHRATRSGVDSAEIGTTTYPAAVHAGARSPRWPGGTAVDAARPGPGHVDPRVARRARRACSRTSASGSGRGTTRGRRGHGRRRAARVPAARDRRRAAWTRRRSARSRSQGAGRRRVPGPAVHQPDVSTLKVGAVRYGVMCGADGMVFDDGTVMRLAEDRFLVTTTTGNAATVLDWMEEWLQTEWPHLRRPVHVGHRAVGHDRAGRAAVAGRCSAGWRRTWPSTTRRSRS